MSECANTNCKKPLNKKQSKFCSVKCRRTFKHPRKDDPVPIELTKAWKQFLGG